MRVAVLAVGSRGDVQPYVALAAGLARAGHEVTVATHAPFADLVAAQRGLAEGAAVAAWRSPGGGAPAARRLGFAELTVNPRELIESEAAAAWISARNPVTFFRRLGELARPLALRLAEDILAACTAVDAEAIVGSSLAQAGFHVAEARGVPFLNAALQPLSPTRDFPSLLTPGLGWLGPRGRRATHRLSALAFELPFRRAVNDWRRSALGLAPLRELDFYGRLARERRPVLYGFSEVVVPKPADWGDWLHVCGYWFLGADPAWRPDPALAAFLAAGPPPVYVGFGSMRVRDPEATGHLVADALRRAGVRGIVGTGWGGLQADADDDLLAVADVPHDWLFPRCAAVVTHGGAGTTATALRAGVPSFAVPFFADQFFWGARVARLGAGPDPLPVRRLDAAALSARIRAAVSAPHLRARAGQVGRALAAEDGVATAVAHISASVVGERIPSRE